MNNWVEFGLADKPEAPAKEPIFLRWRLRLVCGREQIAGQPLLARRQVSAAAAQLTLPAWRPLPGCRTETVFWLAPAQAWVYPSQAATT